MAQYDRYVIGKLLDTYESSLLSREKTEEIFI